MKTKIMIGIAFTIISLGIGLYPGGAATQNSMTPDTWVKNTAADPFHVSIVWDGPLADIAAFKTNVSVGGTLDVTNAANFQSTVAIAGAATAASLTSTGTLAAVAGATVGTTLSVGGAVNIVNGNFGRPIAFGGSITLGATNSTYVLTIDAQTVTLPTAVANRGLLYFVKLVTPAVSATVATTSSQKIDGVSTYSITSSNTVVGFQADGTNWWRVGN